KDAGSKENADPSQAKPDGNDRNGGKENKGEAKQENARSGDNAPEDARRDAENREKADRLNDVLNKKPGDGQGSPEQNQTDKGGDNQRKEG
ncbi:hypothetical protein ACE400_29355, partial [Salmonella enterica]|uniref:hypothetical protein n=1 Tax=Salmonella enterica TaxID=28901 RepID=UPI003D268CC3